MGTGFHGRTTILPKNFFAGPITLVVLLILLVLLLSLLSLLVLPRTVTNERSQDRTEASKLKGFSLCKVVQKAYYKYLK